MATFQNILHVSEHSADGKLFALLSFDGKLKIWNTETNEFQREFVPNFHLNAPFTCFTWITVDGTLGPRKVNSITLFYFHIFCMNGIVSRNQNWLLSTFRRPRKRHNNQLLSQLNILRWELEAVVSTCIHTAKAK